MLEDSGQTKKVLLHTAHCKALACPIHGLTFTTIKYFRVSLSCPERLPYLCHNQTFRWSWSRWTQRPRSWTRQTHCQRPLSYFQTGNLPVAKGRRTHWRRNGCHCSRCPPHPHPAKEMGQIHPHKVTAGLKERWRCFLQAPRWGQD